jgi:hypothetical protein
MQDPRFVDTTPGQRSELGEKKKTFSCLIWLHSQPNAINSTLAVIVAVLAPGACSTAKFKSCALLTHHPVRKARYVKGRRHLAV